MSRQSGKSRQQAQSGAIDVAQELGEINKPWASALSQAGMAYVDSVAKCNGEMCSFLSHRWTKDVDLGRSLAACKDWQQAATLQQDWAREAMEDYLKEVQKLMGLATEFAARGLSPAP